MKGFIRLLEAIIASIILIASISYFFIPAPSRSPWEDTVLSMRAKETLMALEKSGKLSGYVRTNDVASLNSDLKKMLPPSIEFSAEVRNIPNDIIFVECWCTGQEKADMEALLAPLTFAYRNRQIEIRIRQLDSPASINSQTNVLLIVGYESLNSYRQQLDTFLGRGGTIFMLSHLSENQVNDGYMNSVFGLAWTGSSGGSGTFYDTASPPRISYRIAKYYGALKRQDPAGASFGFSGGGVNQIAVDSKSVIVSPAGNSYVKANEFVVNNRGRTVWFSGYEYTQDGSQAQDLKNLTKAAVMWASGEKYRMDPFLKSPGPAFSESRIFSSLDGDGFELALIFWKVFF